MTNPSDFEQVIFEDFEFASKPGERPDVVCFTWHEWPSGQTHRLWRDQLGTSPPCRTDARVLHVHFVSNAELSCYLSLGWPLPVNVLDLNPAFRCITNGRTVPEGRGLHGALAYFQLPPSFDSKRKAEFVAAPARMEHAGVPIDMETFPLLTDERAWRYVRDAMVPTIDAAYGVYIKGPDGDWHFSMELFERYLERTGITGWPLTKEGKLSTKRKTFENMTKGHPQLEGLRQLRYARDKMRKIKLAVGADGRNRTVLWPFKSKTGRTQPKASQWIFSPAVWLRSLIKPGPGQAVAYVDYSSMEFMIAASLSGDPVMIEFYRSGDPYLSFAKRVGTAPKDATKKTHEPLRDRYKTGLLAIQYSVQAETLAGRLGISSFAAHEMLAQHRQLFAVYWQWAEDWLAHALDTGIMRTVLGWECRTGITEFNGRSIQNFPVQAHGADILRIACVWATRYGLRLLAPIHDALLIEAPIEQIEAHVALLQEIMRRASRVVLNPTADGTLELRTDCKIVRYPERYTDSRGDAIWADVLRLLAEYQQQPTTTTTRQSEGA